MDSLLKELASIDAGINLGNTYTDFFGHADDLKSLCPNIVSLQRQASSITNFCEANFLPLNMEKLDLLCLSNNQSPNDLYINLNGKQIQCSLVVRCLSTYWMHNLSPETSIEKNISKARKAYFALGSTGFTATFYISLQSLHPKFLKCACSESVSMVVKTVS